MHRQNHRRPFRRGGHHLNPRPNDDLRNKINRIKNTREIEYYSKNETIESADYNDDDEQSISLSSSDEEETLVQKSPKRSRSRSRSRSRIRSRSPNRSRSPTKSKKKSVKKHKKDKKKKKKKSKVKSKSKSKSKSKEKEILSYEQISSSESEISLSPQPDDDVEEKNLTEIAPPPDRNQKIISSNPTPPPRCDRSRSPPKSRHASPKYSPNLQGRSKRMYSSRREQHKRPDKRKWEEDVDDFLTKMNSNSKKPDQSEHEEEIDHKEEDEQEPSCDNISLTSLMKFVAQKLESKKSLYLKGPFQYR